MNKQKKDLLKSFMVRVNYPNVSGFEALELLDVRSSIAEFASKLTKEEKSEPEKAGSLFQSNVKKFYRSVAKVADLHEIRKLPVSHLLIRGGPLRSS
ncbi:MAG TPA: hypothetical protein VGA95_11710 [Thermodesulfobacteriota bacterium]